MEKKAKVYYVDQKGLERLENEIDSLREKFNTLKSLSYDNSTDRYDTEFQENVRMASVVLSELNILNKQIIAGNHIGE